LGKSFTNSI